MHWIHEYANEVDDDVPKPAQSLSTPCSAKKNVSGNLGYTVGEIIHDMIIVCKVIFKKRKRIDAIKRGNKRSG